MNPYTIKNFFAWLNSKPKGTLVGIRGRCYACPLAKFTKETLGIPEPSCGEMYFGGYNPSDGRTIKFKPTEWGKKFIQKIDSKPLDLTGFEFVTKEEALATLKKITKKNYRTVGGA